MKLGRLALAGVLGMAAPIMLVACSDDDDDDADTTPVAQTPTQQADSTPTERAETPTAVAGVPGGTATATGTAGSGRSETVELEERNDSGISGEAEFTAAGANSTRVSIELEGDDVETADFAAHIRRGDCDDDDDDDDNGTGAMSYPLTDITGGQSTSTVAVSMDTLDDDHVIEVTRAAAAGATAAEVVACGDIDD